MKKYCFGKVTSRKYRTSSSRINGLLQRNEFMNNIFINPGRKRAKSDHQEVQEEYSTFNFEETFFW